MKGGKRPGAGRPKGSIRPSKPEVLTVKKMVRWTVEEWGRIEEASERLGLTNSEFIRWCVRPNLEQKLPRPIP